MTLEERGDKFCKTHVVSAAMRQDIILLAQSVADEARDETAKMVLERCNCIDRQEHNCEEIADAIRAMRQRGEK